MLNRNKLDKMTIHSKWLLKSTAHSLTINKKINLSTRLEEFCFFSIKKSMFFILFLLLICMQSSLVAQSTSMGMQVSAEVKANCRIENGAINFGVYDPIAANESTPVSVVGDLKMRCTRNTVAMIGMDAGQHASRAVGTSRAMVNNTNNEYLSYEIYTNSNYSTVWNESTRVTHQAESSQVSTINVYAKIPANQNVQDGSYTDSILVTANF